MGTVRLSICINNLEKEYSNRVAYPDHCFSIQEQDQFKNSSSIRPHMEIIERLVAAPQAPVASTNTATTTAARSRKSTGAASSCDTTTSIDEGSAKKPRGARKKESECEGGAGAATAAQQQGSVGSAASVSSGTVTPTRGLMTASTPQVKVA
jgi:hypothetical protein